MTTLACARRALPALAAALVLAGCTTGTSQFGARSAPAATPASTPRASVTSAQPLPTASASSSGPVATPTVTPTASPSSRPTASAGSSARPGDLTVHVTYSGRAGAALEVAGFVETLDADGSCLAEASGAGKTTRITGPAVPDASTVSCGTLDIPSAGLGAGPWTIRLGYTLGGAESWSPTVKVMP